MSRARRKTPSTTPVTMPKKSVEKVKREPGNNAAKANGNTEEGDSAKATLSTTGASPGRSPSESMAVACIPRRPHTPTVRSGILLISRLAMGI